MKVAIQKTDYPRKRAEFSVWVTDEKSEADGMPGFFCALPQTDEPRARVVAAAMERLIETTEGRALVVAADDELLGCY
jgi:hypothetical protein